MAPIAPFYADQLFLDLVAVTGRENVESVHLSDFPVYDESKIDKNLEERMQMAQDVSSMVLALRRKVNIKVSPAVAYGNDSGCRRSSTREYRGCEEPDLERGEREGAEVRG